MLVEEKKYQTEKPCKAEHRIGLFVFILFTLIPAYAAADYPEIHRLASTDLFFRQIQADVSNFYKTESRGAEPSDPTIYRYSIKEGDNLFSLAARLSISYDALASINRLDSPDFPNGTDEILVPNMPGLYIPKDPENDLENMLVSSRNPETGRSLIIHHKDEFLDFTYYPGEKFTKDERSFFLKVFFKNPVHRGYLSSLFGYRNNPFNGKRQFHRGIDIAASEGEDVYPARDGRVVEIGYDNVLGKYIRLAHGSYFETVYAHLKTILVELNDEVTSTMIIGRVGNTGLSTGSHLHFEIRTQGKARDPLRFLAKAGY